MFSRNRRGIQSSTYARKKRKKIIFAAILFLLALGSVITDMSLLSKADFLQITSVQVTGASLVSPDALRATVEEELARTWWWGIFSRNSIFLYPKDVLQQEIVKDFPPIATVSFSHTGLHVLTVLVSERNPFALACDSALGGADASCFYMDSTGFIYAPAPQFSPGVYVTYAPVSSSTDPAGSVNVGAYLTDPADFDIARQAIDYISSFGLTVVGINVPTPGTDAAGDFQLFIQRQTSTAASSSLPIAVYFNTDQPIDTTLQYFSTFWQHESDKNFQYIDLRYGKDIVFTLE